MNEFDEKAAMKSNKLRGGQRVKVEIEGVVREVNEGGAHVILDDETNWWIGATDGAKVTIVAEPGPAEPTGLGAVVEGRIGDLSTKWVRLGYGRWQDPFDEHRWTKWEFLADVTLISPGAE
jgi:hypothetical protein